MTWWGAVILIGTAILMGLLLPWRVQVHLSTSGLVLQLMLIGKIKVLAYHRKLGNQSTIGADRFSAELSKMAQLVTIDSFFVFARYLRGMIVSTKANLEISGEIGLGDPALTGAIYGFAYSLSGACGGIKIDLKPNFFETVIDGEIKINAIVVPLFIFMRSVKTAFHPAIRRIWLALIMTPGAVNTEEVQNVGS